MSGGFPAAARDALGDEQLRRNLRVATHTIRAKRAAVVAERPVQPGHRDERRPAPAGGTLQRRLRVLGHQQRPLASAHRVVPVLRRMPGGNQDQVEPLGHAVRLRAGRQHVHRPAGALERCLQCRTGGVAVVDDERHRLLRERVDEPLDRR